MTTIPRLLPDQIAELFERIEEIDRRLENKKRVGTVSEVDPGKGLARVKLSEDGEQPFLTDWIPWGEIAAGNIKSFIPPSVGQQVNVISQNGDLSDATIDMSLPSNENPRPHNKADEMVLEIGGTRFFMSGNELRITADKIVLDGEVHVGGEGGEPAALLGSVDVAGHEIVSQVSSRVRIKL